MKTQIRSVAAPCILSFAALFGSPASADQSPVNIGLRPNDGTGDAARSAYIKLNANDAELYAAIAAIKSQIASLALTLPASPTFLGTVTASSLAVTGSATIPTLNVSGTTTASKLALTGSGSTGDVSGMSVATPLVSGGQPLTNWFTNPTLAGLTPRQFPFAASRIVLGSNPDGQASWSKLTGKNPIGFLSDVGGYGDPVFTVVPIPEAITGAMNIPSTGSNAAHGSGVAGYSRTAATNMGAVGLYGQGDMAATGTIAWGFNTRSIDNGFVGNLWGGEIDINASAAGTFARGLDITGGSTAQIDPASPGIIVQTPGLGNFGTATPIRWGRGVFIADESAVTGVEVGAALAQANSGSMPITFFYRGASNARTEAARIYATGGGNTNIEVTSNTALLRLRGDLNGTKTNNVTIYGPNTGIGDGGGLPSYPLDVTGPARFGGAVGFNGAAPAGKCTLSAALPTDGSATNVALATAINAVRSCLITNGLAQ